MFAQIAHIISCCKSVHLNNNFFINIRYHFQDEWNKLVNFRIWKLSKIEELYKVGIDEGYFRQVNINILRMILSSCLDALFNQDNMRNLDMTWKQAIGAIGDIIFYKVFKRICYA